MALLVVVVQVEEGRVARARQRTSELALEASSTRAERDSTRRVGALEGRVARLLHDSLRLAERLVVQKTQRQDELDRAQRRERVARYRATVKTDSLATIARGVVATSHADTGRVPRRASFLIRQVPYTVTAEVASPEKADTGVMSIRVARDTVHLEARVGCGAPDANGIRGATVGNWAEMGQCTLQPGGAIAGIVRVARAGVVSSAPIAAWANSPHDGYRPGA